MAPMTVAYAAPESFRGKPTIKSDQYSLAITYFELRTARLPYRSELFAEVIDDGCIVTHTHYG